MRYTYSMKTIHAFLLSLVAAAFLTGCTKPATYAEDQLTGSRYLSFDEPVIITPDLLQLSAAIINSPKGTITEYGFKYSSDGSSPVSLFSAKTVAGVSVVPGQFTSNFDVSSPGLEYAMIAYVIIDGQYYYSNIYRYTSLPRGEWKKAANFPGPPRSFPFYFIANGKGYMGCGWNGTAALKDCWEFDPTTESWTQLTDFPGKARSSPIFFSLGNKGYVGAGSFDEPLTSHAFLAADFYSFDAASRTWQQLKDFPARQYLGEDGICGTYNFSLGGYGFAGGGHISWQNDCFGLYRYDTAADIWTPQSEAPLDYHKTAYRLNNAACFVIGDTAFVGTGVSDFDINDAGDNFFRYHYTDNSWEYIGPFPGGSTTGNVGFTNSGFGYIGVDKIADLWQYKNSGTDRLFKVTTRSPDSYLNKGGIAFTFGNKTYMGLGEPISTYFSPQSMYIFSPTR